MTVIVPPGGRVLFIGDSLTDTGRDREQPDDLGRGYALMAAGWFTARHPTHGATFVNRGISGDRVRDLRARWERDCLALAPQVVSILIGINDSWWRYSRADETPVERFEDDYRQILGLVRQHLDAGLILVEPFLIPLSDEQRTWREDLDPKVGVVRKLAAEFDATLVAVDDIFADSGLTSPVWTYDGVHLSPGGHAVLAEQWLRAIEPASCAGPVGE